MIIKYNPDLLTYLNRLVAADTHSSSISRRTFTKGQLLISQGDCPQWVYLLTGGIVKCFITEENGRSYVLEFLGEGEMLGELELLTGTNNLSTVEALTDVTAYQISQDLFHSYLLEEPHFNRLLLQELALRLSRTAQRASYQQIFPVEYAILKVLFLFTESQPSVSKQNLADYLAIPVRSLNRILARLSAQNLFTATTKTALTVSRERLTELIIAYH
ncbi:hypothetical protein GCM10028808_70520 [Spirosoma migulaei]